MTKEMDIIRRQNKEVEKERTPDADVCVMSQVFEGKSVPYYIETGDKLKSKNETEIKLVAVENEEKADFKSTELAGEIKEELINTLKGSGEENDLQLSTRSTQQENQNIQEVKVKTWREAWEEVKQSMSFILNLNTKFATVGLIIGVVAVGGFSYFNKAKTVRSEVLGVSRVAQTNIDQAIKNLKEQDFIASADNFSSAYSDFSEISNSLEGLGKITIEISKFIPIASKLSSGYYLSEAGKNLALAGEQASALAQTLDGFKSGHLKEDIFTSSNKNTIPVLNIFRIIEKDVEKIRINLLTAQSKLQKIKIDDIPREKQKAVIKIENSLPVAISLIDNFSEIKHIVADLLGANGPRKYLFLFQNNQEMRATGGFIGSYGVLDINSKGEIRNFFVDGIFNPDGQLRDKIIPPKPIQKISTAWSLHDSNWWPDFPTSAQKAISFYEKTGGPTVDGVITLTPTAIQKLLAITGPIRMNDYETTLTADNFIQNIQYEVEEDYDKEENRPKKILADLMPILLNRLLNGNDLKLTAQVINILNESLREKHILIYSDNQELQKIISEAGWSGEILSAEKDYLSVVNTNINGYKTDGVIEEKIEHTAEVSEDGSIIDTVIITRKHTGGQEKYEWWNKVNANYMRVYVPLGSELLSVEGQTREINESPVDYDALNFETDEDVEKEEDGMIVDENTGTRAYEDSKKTVFGNWVYVSPQEEVVVKYVYRLPFKINFDEDKEFGSYSLLAQKQSGSLGDKFFTSIKYPKNWKVEWQAPLEFKAINSGQINLQSNLKTDKFIGVVFKK